MRTRQGKILALIMSLAACVPVGSGGLGTRALSVAGGTVTVAGPKGYCIDRSESRDSASGAFVLLGSCSSLTGSRSAGQPSRPAILTASVGPASASGTNLATALPAMASFFESSAGRAALSRSGRAETVSVERIGSSGGVLYIRLRDAAVVKGRGVEPGYWRALMALGGRVVTLSVLSPTSKPLGPSEQRAVLDIFVAQMRAANTGAVQG